MQKLWADTLRCSPVSKSIPDGPKQRQAVFVARGRWRVGVVGQDPDHLRLSWNGNIGVPS